MRQKEALKAGLIRRDRRHRTLPGAAGASTESTFVRKTKYDKGNPTQRGSPYDALPRIRHRNRAALPRRPQLALHSPPGHRLRRRLRPGDQRPRAWYNRSPDGEIQPSLTRQQAQSLVNQLTILTDPEQTSEPYTLLTWNGLGFDLDILAEESGMTEQCQQMALNHVDMMFHIFATLGYPLGLDKAAQGMGTPGKPEGMNGALANDMWNSGDRLPVIQYCASDVRSTLALAHECEAQRRLQWTSNTGRTRFFNLPNGWLTVRQALDVPEPDRSWMTDPLPRENFTGWLGL